MRLLIQTAERVLLDRDNLLHVRLPVADGGSIGVRRGHHPLIGEVARGVVFFSDVGETGQLDVEPGLVQIENDLVTVFTSGAADENLLQIADTGQETRARLTAFLQDRYGKAPQTH